jgi:hypothetical protein
MNRPLREKLKKKAEPENIDLEDFPKSKKISPEEKLANREKFLRKLHTRIKS